MTRSDSFLSFLLLLALLLILPEIDAWVACNSTAYCQEFFNISSTECLPDETGNGICSSPFAAGGCLHNFKPGWTKLRVCNSEDTPETIEKGHCRVSQWEYGEVRFLSQNWESAFMVSWIQQILLSEVLDVPTSMETGMKGKRVQFYDHKLSMDYGTSNDWEALRRATDLEGDCTLMSSRTASSYETCAHVNPEVWEGQLEFIQGLMDSDKIEPAIGNGALGHQSWYIPKLTALKDPSLLHYLSFQGEKNRRKMAETFLWPTTWKEYCEEVSVDGCQSANQSATRAPIGDEEGALFYSDGSFKGHFRFTDMNNCTLNPSTCRGHMADFPCTWSSYAQPQAHYNEIAVETVIYTYGELLQIWAAANETQSDLLLHWWTPEAKLQEMVTTDFQLMRVNLPPPNQDCIDSRITPADRCSENITQQLGDPMGACDEPSFSLQKVLAKSLYAMSKGPGIPEAAQSPAYDMVKGFTITDFQIGKIFDYWLEARTQDSSYNLREATCRWVVENFDDLQAFVPRTYPRVFEDSATNTLSAPLNIAALVFGVLAIVLIGGVSIGVYRQRERRVMQHAQVEFLAVLLVGLILVSLAALMLALPPTNWSCVTVTWLFNVGYTGELVPLVVKISAILRMMRAAKRCRRVVLKRSKLFRDVAILCMIVIIFMALWTGIDPPQKQTEYQLTDQQNASQETVVTSTSFCQSSSDTWRFISVTWHVLLLVTATVLAFQTRTLQHDLNESHTLAIMIYSHFFFVILRVVSFFLEDSIGAAQATLARSILLSADVVATACIYFVPKLFASDISRSSSFLYSSRRTRSRILNIIGIHSTPPNESQNRSSEGHPERSNQDSQNVSVDIGNGDNANETEAEPDQEQAIGVSTGEAYGMRCRHCGEVN